MNIIKAGSRPQKKASLEYFQGNVFQDPIIESPEPARVRAIKVLFEPKARTAWHTHCLLYTSPSPRDLSTSRMPSSA